MSGVCPFTFTKELILHSLLTFALLAVLMIQGTLLDLYLIKSHRTSVTHYFWLVPDFLLMVGFGVAMFGGFQINKKLKSKKHPRKRHNSVFKHKYFLGFNPYTYSMWFLYSILLVAKISIIFKEDDVTDKFNHEEFFGPQLLKMLLASAAVVFVFVVEGHNNY